MRKSFTRFLSVFMLFCAFGLQAAFAVASHWDGTKSIPKDENLNVIPGDISTQFVLAFDAAPAVTATGGTLVVYKGSTIVKLVPITQSSADVSVVGKTLVVKHGAPSFAEGTGYSITLSLGAVKVGADDVSILPAEYTFTIGDFTPPVLATTNPLVPVDGATNVEANLFGASFDLMMTFNEGVKAGTGDIAVYNVNGTVIDLIRVTPTNPRITISGSTVTATINVDPASFFAAQNDYFVKVDAGTFVDITGNNNKYAGITNTTVWNFSTRDNSAPVITASVPAADIAATSAKLNVMLSEAGKVTYSVDGGAYTAPDAVAANTNKVYTITGLTSSATHTVSVVASNNETPPNVSAPTVITFTTKDDQGPMASARDQIVEDKKTTGVYLLFDEEVTGGTGLLSVRKVSDNSLVYSVPASAVTSTKLVAPDANAGKWKAVIKFGGALASTGDYFVVFPKGYMKDMSGNAYGDDVPGILVPENYLDWTINSSDFVAPVVTFATTTVAAGSGNITGAALTDDVKIVFNEDVVLADGTIGWPAIGDFASWSKYLALQKDGINVPAAYSYAANTITINPTSDFPSNTTYTLIMRAGIVKDHSPNGNVLADGKTITVTSGDLDVLAATFGPAGIDAANTALTIKFNKAVRTITGTTPFYAPLTNANVESTLELKKNGTTVDPLDYTTTYDAASMMITVVPSAGKSWESASALVPVTYTLTILGSKIEDNSGADLATVTNTYLVVDFKKPVATLVANEVLASVPLTITFDEAITPITASSPDTYFMLKSNDAQGNNLPFTFTQVGNVVTIIPTVAVELGKTYYYGVGASMADATGNVNLAAYKSVKIVGVVIPPAVDALTYTVNGGAVTPIADTYQGAAKNVDGNIVVKVTFNVNVDDKDLTAINTVATNFAPANIGVTIVSDNVSGKVLTITIPNPTIAASEPGTEYTITIPQNLIEANEAYTGTTFAQMPGNVVIKLKTKDTQLPTFTAVPTGAGVAMDAVVKLTFSEPVTPVAGKTITFKTGTTNVEETVSITSANVVKDGTVTDGTIWEVKHAAFVKYGSLYDVVVGKDAFVDAAANNLGAADVTFLFTTMPNPAPMVSAFSPKDEADMVALTPQMTIVFNEPVVQASITGSRKLVYVIEKKGAADATINGAGDLVLGGDDVQKYYAYVDDITKIAVDGATVTIKGVTLEVAKEYYVLITPGAFKDVSLGLPAAQPFAGITSYGATAVDPWNFTTSDVYAPEVALSFTKVGSDGLAAADSDIKLTFSKKIAKNGGAAISNSDLSALPTPLIVLEKWNVPTSAWVNIKFTGTITNENVITIDNSSLVILNEMKTGTKYRVSYGTPVLEGKDSHTDLAAYAGEFWTTDVTAPTAPVITYKVDEVNSISYNTTDGDVIDVNIKSTDVNSGLADHTAIKVYYLKSTYDGTLTANDVKGLSEATGDDDFDKTWKGGMESKTSYFIYAVAEDVAGNLSGVSKLETKTDDRVKPTLAGALPTSFDAAGNISLVFNEAVKPSAGATARVIDNATGIVYTMPLANLATGTDAALKTITIVGGPFAQMSNDVANYTIEINPGMIVDVPRQVAAVDVNAVNAWDGIVGTSFQVVSKDQVKPTMAGIAPSGLVNLNQAFTLSFSEPVNLNNTFTQFLVFDGTTPYDVVNASEISGQGTNAIVVSPKRALVSGKTYTLVITDLVFSDLSGNVMNSAMLATRTATYIAKDVVGLAASFKADATTLPSSSALASVPSTLTIDLGEAFFLTSALDPNVNTFDLQSHVYLNQAGTPVSFTAMQFGTTIVLSNLNGSGLGTGAKGKSYTFGFVNLYDAQGNMTTGAETSFSVATDAVVNQVVTFTPGDNDNDSGTKVNITVDQTFKIEFSGIIYSYNATESLNNLIMTKALLTSLGTISMTPIPADATLDITDYSVVGGKSVVTLKVSKALTSETNYVLHLNVNHTIQIGQGFASMGTYHEGFTTADVKAPKLIADGDGNTLAAAYQPVKVGVVGKDQTLALVFDEKVIGAGQVLIHRWDGVLMATVDITGVVSTNVAPWIIKIGTPAEIMATNPLFVTNVDYYIVVPAGAITDVAATPNAFAGITAVNEWKVSLKDDTTPQVVFVDDTKDGMAVNTKIKLTFDRPVELGKGWLAVYYDNGKAVDLVRTVAGSIAMSSYDFTLSQELAPNTKFWVELGEGTFDLAADNSFKQEQQHIGGWYFTTEVNSVPVAITYSPVDETPGVALTSGLSITFDQDVIAGTGNIQLHRKQNVGGPIITNFNVADATKVTFVGNTLTIAGDVLNLQNNSDYYVIIPGTAVKNTSSSPEFWGGVTVPFEWQFTTLNDAVAPTAIYAPMAVGLKPADIKLTMTFNEPVVAGLGNLVIYNAADDAVVETVVLTQAMLAGQVVTVTPTKLAESMSYYVMVDAGSVKDLAGNNFAGVSNKTDWTFGTGDFTAPTPLSWTPMGQQTDNHPTFVITYSSDVQFGTAGNLKVIPVGSLTPTLTIPVTAAMVSGSKVTVNYVANATTGLNKFTAYYVLVDAGIVKDIAGNAATGIIDPLAWTFTTGDFKVGIGPNVSLEFKVYPNPFVDYVNVANASLLSKIVVTNIAGQTVKQVVNPTERIQLNELRSGVYFMSMYDMDNVVKGTAKIVKR